MRIATSTLFDQQTSAIDNLAAQEALYGKQLSTGIALNQPSDDPSQIAQYLSVQTDIGVQTQVGQNLTNLSSQLTTVDGALGNVTNIIQSARTLAIQAASDANSPAQMQEIGIQVNQLLQEAVSLANTQYAGHYVFAGTAAPSSQPVTINTSSASIVSFSGNIDTPEMKLPSGQTIAAGVTIQQAFNYDAADGSANLFQVLDNLYNTLNDAGKTVPNTSLVQVNTVGTSIIPTTTLSALTTVGGGYAATPLTLDNGVPPGASISIASATSPSGTTISFTPGETMAAMVTAINADTPATGVTASFNYETEKLTLTGGGPFTVTDVPTPSPPATTAATTSGNFVEAFQLQNQATTVNELSRQLGDIDHVTQVLLNSRAVVGSTIQQVGALSGSTQAQLNNDTTVQSNIADTNVAKVTAQFSLAQTALQAAYATTNRLEQKDLFDFLT